MGLDAIVDEIKARGKAEADRMQMPNPRLQR